jgi:hypothetical protein
LPLPIFVNAGLAIIFAYHCRIRAKDAQPFTLMPEFIPASDFVTGFGFPLHGFSFTV